MKRVAFDQFEFRFPNITDHQSDAIDYWVRRMVQLKKDIYATDAVEFSKWLNQRGIEFRFFLKKGASLIKRLWIRPFIRSIAFYEHLTQEQIRAQKIAAQRNAQEGSPR